MPPGAPCGGGNIPSELNRAACDGYIKKHQFSRAARIEALRGIYYNYRRDNEWSITHHLTGRRLFCNAFVWHSCFPLCRAHCPGGIGVFAARGLSAAVKAYAVSLETGDLTVAEQRALVDMMGTFLPHAGWRRLRDQVLARAILSGHLALPRWYAAGKIRKEARRSERNRQRREG